MSDHRFSGLCHARWWHALVCLGVACMGAEAARADDYPAPTEGDFVTRDFRFASGESLPELRIHYRTLGAPRRDAHGVVRNAVLVMHGTGGSGKSLVRAEFAGELFGAGQPLDASRYFIVLPDGLGHGASSKPSDGLKAHFPRYGYRDMVEAEYLLLTRGLNVNQARLVMGTSMAACTPGCGASCTPTSWTHSCRLRASRPRSPGATACGAAW